MAEKPLQGRIAVVAGATRGAGRGIARALGEAGAVVYCAGRTVRGSASKERPETIEETAELVDAAGGRGIPARVDFLEEAQVKDLFARVKSEQGRLDLLVNDVWGGDAAVEFGQAFWELDLAKGLPMVRNAVETHIVSARHAVPLFIDSASGARGNGLLVEITDGDSYAYRGNLLYDLVKTSIIRLAFGMAWELRRKGVSALAVTPGFLRSEAMLDLFGVTEATWRDGAKKDPHFIASETPLYVGRAVAALAADPKVAEKSGRVFASWTLSDEYGFTDADGSRPHWGRHFEKSFGPGKPADAGFYDYWLKGMPESVFGDWPP